MISIVIPVLEDAAELRRNLPRLVGLSGDMEIIVVDGGRDRDVAAAAREHGARCVPGPRGRGSQLNRGAMTACGSRLLFLHADCWLDPGALDEVERLLDDPTVAAGTFEQHLEGSRFTYRLIERAAALRTRYLRCPYGDSGLFLRRELFQRVGGFPDLPLCEDIGMARRLRRHGRFCISPRRIHVSARRFEQRGVVRTTLLNGWMALGFRLGIPPARLYRTYYGRALEDPAPARRSDRSQTLVR